MKLENLSPEQKKEWQKMLEENQRLKEKLSVFETARDGDLPALLSRPEFVREIARMVAHDERYGGTSCLLVLSFDGLEEYKSLLGPYAYDEILRTIADGIMGHVRACDIAGRTGAEAFSIMLTRCKLDDAEKKAESLVALLEKRLNPLLKGKAAVGLSYMVSILNSREDAKKTTR